MRCLSPFRDVVLTAAAYGWDMHSEALRFHGSYRYASRQVLARALAGAQARLDEEELHDLGPSWLRSFLAAGATLQIDATLPAGGDRFAAAAVVQALALDALDGLVEARRGGLRVDAFPPGGDDADD